MRHPPAQAFYSLGEREVRVFSIGLTALLVLTFGAGLLVGTFWTGPAVEQARREAEERTRLAGFAEANEPDERSPPDTEPVRASDSVSEPAPFAEPPALVVEPTRPADPEPAAREDIFRAWPAEGAPSARRVEPRRSAPEPPPAGEPALTAPAAPEGAYALQLGIFSVESNASAMVARLAARGYEPYQVAERRAFRGSAKTLYSVRIGGYPTYGQAQQQAAELRAREGMEVMIRRPEG